MALKVIDKIKDEPKAKKKLKVVATEPEVDPEEPEEDEPKVVSTIPASIKKPKKAKQTEAEVGAEKPEPKSKSEAKRLAAQTKKEVSTSKVPEVLDAKTLIEEARGTYRAFQVSWFDFAKKLKEIRDCEAWTAAGHDDFTSLCREEFPSIPPSTISKFIKVVEEFGTAIEARSKTTKALPSYDALYEVAVNESKLPKDEAMRLRKAVVDCKISTREVREVVRGLVSTKKPTKHAEGRSEKKKARDEELGIKREDTADAEATDEDVEVDEAEEITSSIDKNADALLKQVRQLLDRLPSVTESMKEGTAKLIELAEALEELQAPINDYLDRLEQVSN